MKLRRTGALALACSVWLVASTFAAKAEDKAFVLIPGIPGDSTDSAHAGWIDAYGLDWNAVSTTSGPVVTTFNPVSFLKGTDKASPLLMIALAQSTFFSAVTIDVCRQTAPQQCY